MDRLKGNRHAPPLLAAPCSWPSAANACWSVSQSIQKPSTDVMFGRTRQSMEVS